MKKILLFSFFIFLFTACDQGGAMAEEKELSLPKAKTKGALSLEEAIAKRRSVRSFKDKDLGLDEISQLLWSAQGVTGKKGSFNLRAAPSAGATYPMEIYLANKDGFFRYIPDGHKLKVLGAADLRPALSEACLGQKAVKGAPLVLIICGAAERITPRYGQRGIMYMHIEAGHIAQNIHLQAVALGLASLPVGAFSEEQVKNILKLPKGEAPAYIIPVGYEDQ